MKHAACYIITLSDKKPRERRSAGLGNVRADVGLTWHLDLCTGAARRWLYPALMCPQAWEAAGCDASPSSFQVGALFSTNKRLHLRAVECIFWIQDVSQITWVPSSLAGSCLFQEVHDWFEGSRNRWSTLEGKLIQITYSLKWMLIWFAV